jgi:hypothetical protein
MAFQLLSRTVSIDMLVVIPIEPGEMKYGEIRNCLAESRTCEGHPRRRHSLEKGSNHALYVLQELVDDGCLGYWTTISDLEVLVGGRAA